MKKSLKKLLSIMLVLSFTASMLIACGKKQAEDTGNENVTQSPADNEDTEDDTEATPIVEDEPTIDLGGMEIVIGDWWSPQEPDEPKTQQEEDTLAYRNMIQEKYNFTMKQVSISDWGGMQELFTTSVMSGDPAANIVILQPNWTAQPLANGLLYDLSTLDNLSFNDSKWNHGVVDLMTYGDSVYGMAVGNPEPRGGVFWNKRLFEEAGLDPDLPYDLQASGEWTWEKFEELCKTLTRDTNNDGTIDTYAMVSFNSDYLKVVPTSNDAKFIGKDGNGKFYNATSEPQFMESMQWALSLIQKGYEMPQPPDSNWDWFIPAFHDAKVAMTFAEQYKVGTWADMTDDWGFVLCPKPKADSPYSVYFSDNIAVIPSCYDKETAEKIAFAYNLWTNPTPGYENETDAWKETYYTRFRDERAVDETLALMYDKNTRIVNDFSPFVYGIDMGPDFYWDVAALSKTPAEKLEEISGKWQSFIDDANK